MSNNKKFYINGAWVDPIKPASIDVINPATEEVAGQVSLGSRDDVDLAVRAARSAFPKYSRASKEERLQLFDSIIRTCEKHTDALADAITKEMGSPLWFSK